MKIPKLPNNYKFPLKTIPLALFAILILAFALFIKDTGFYQDDWHHIFFAHALGLSRLKDMFLYDGRPAAAPLYIAVFSVLGFQPIHWQIFTLALRFLTVLFIWFLSNEIWPEYKRQTAWVAVLFAVHPLFKLQQLSVAYMVHWMGFLLFAISIWAMVRSIRKQGAFWGYTLLALLTSGLHLIFLEYYSGVELIRPFILWLLLSKKGLSSRNRLVKTALLWLPYLLVLAGFFVYRIFLIPSPEPGFERNTPTVLFDLIKSPIATGLDLAQRALQDLMYVMVNVWTAVFNPALVEITRPASIKVLAIVVIAGLALFFYLSRLKFGDAPEPVVPWYRSAIWIGLALTLFGPIPGWLINKSAGQDINIWHDRYAMASMIGASILLVAILEWLVKEQRPRTILFVVLIVVSIGSHILDANDYRWAWVKQKQFYTQLYWRAPFIEPNTTLLADQEFLPLMGQLAVGYSIANLYPKLDQEINTNYWFYSLYEQFNDQRQELVEGMPFNYSKNFGRFNGNSLDSLVVYFVPENGQCLWVLRPQDSQIRTLPKILQDVAQISNLGRIKPSAPSGYKFPEEIFGKEPQPDWCFYYEKASLADQYQQWDQVAAYWETAQNNGFSPSNGVEYLPFIEGFAHVDDWDQASKLTLRSSQLTSNMRPILCTTWKQIEAETPDSPARADAIARVQDKFNCTP
jgi:hypothetical protein